SERAAALPADIRLRVASGLAQRFMARFPQFGTEPQRFLDLLHAEERSRRRGRFGARASAVPGAARPVAGNIAERLAARKSTRWDEFAAMADRATTRGLDSFSAAELPDFAARYREVASDLARARTYRARPAILE